MGAATQYNINSVTKGVNGFGLPSCNTIYSATLAASDTPVTLTVPGINAIGVSAAPVNNRFIAVFSYEPAKKVYVAINATAAKPAAATFGVSTCELNPPAKEVKAGDVLSIFCSAGADITVAFYSILDC